MVKAVIFDWGGVVAPNSEDGWLNVLANKLGITLQACLPYWNSAGYSEFSKGLISESEFWNRLETSYGKPLPSGHKDIWVKGSALTPWSEVIELVEELKTRGIEVAVLSNTVSPMTKLARQADLYKPFNTVVLSDEVGLTKPDPEIYKYTLAKLGLKGSNCIYVDDLPRNLPPAEELGMHTILATSDPKRAISNIKDILSE